MFGLEHLSTALAKVLGVNSVVAAAAVATNPVVALVGGGCYVVRKI